MSAVSKRCTATGAVSVMIGLVLVLLGSNVSADAGDEKSNTPNFRVHGFLRLDAIRDDSKLQNHQYAFWVLSEDCRIGSTNDSHFTIHPRVTRLGLELTPRSVSSHVDIGGVLEVDFQNGGTESREILRMRVAYFKLYNDLFGFLGGQDWDVISPLFPDCHTDGILWNAGNLGDRHPQMKLWFASDTGVGRMSAAAAAGLTGAVDNKDLDNNGRLDGQDSGLPFIQTRLGLERTLAQLKVKGGIWSHYAREETETPVGGHSKCRSWSAGFDLSTDWKKRVTLKTEGWLGVNVSDVRGGIGQGVNPLTGTEVDSRGGWAQIGVKPVEKWWVYVGASADDPKDEHVPTVEEVEDAGLTLGKVGRTLNWTAFVSNRLRLYEPFQIGLEYFYWVTEYRGLQRGVNNRVNLHFSYFF